jgi:hypothetical protein
MICKRGTTGTRAYFTATNTTLAVGIHGENGIDLDCANTLGGNQVTTSTLVIIVTNHPSSICIVNSLHIRC